MWFREIPAVAMGAAAVEEEVVSQDIRGEAKRHGHDFPSGESIRRPAHGQVVGGF